MRDRGVEASVRHLTVGPAVDRLRLAWDALPTGPRAAADSTPLAHTGVGPEPGRGLGQRAEVDVVSAAGVDPGWQAVALVLRATGRLARQATAEPAPGEDDTAVPDLARAEALLRAVPADSWVRGCVSSGLAAAYHLMGLYELALPHLAGPAGWPGRPAPTPVDTWLREAGLAGLHLDWAADLDRAGVEGAAGHRVDAARHARAAMAVAVAVLDTPRIGAEPTGHPSTSPDIGSRHRDRAELLLACATAGQGDPVEVAERIEELLDAVDDGRTTGLPGQVLPHLAQAQLRAGRPAAAAATARRAVVAAGRNWVVESQARGVLLEVLAAQRHAGAEEGLVYGRLLSVELWRRRVRRLEETRTLVDLEFLRHENLRVARLSAEDPLTGLANRRAFDDALDAVAGGPVGDRIAVLAVDVDGFKAVNDSAGHPVGDVLLKRVGAALRSVTRAQGDLVARVGGDEFVLVLPDLDTDQAAEVGRRAVAAVRALPADDLPGGAPTVSIGVAAGHGTWVRALVVAADDALLAAKRAGKNGVAVARSAQTPVGPELTSSEETGVVAPTDPGSATAEPADAVA